MLAATWGDITGAPGVCLSTRGPGAANMVNGVAHAVLDRSPLIAITDRYATPQHEVGLRQRIDHLAMYAADGEVGHDDRRPRGPPAGGAAPCAPRPRPRRGRCSSTCRRARPTKEAGELHGAAAADAEPGVPRARAVEPEGRRSRGSTRARRPILLAGLGRLLGPRVGRAGAAGRAAGRAGADHLQAQGRDPRGSPAARRLHHRRPDRAQAGEQADLIITVGLDAVELQPKPWPYDDPRHLAGQRRRRSTRWCRPRLEVIGRPEAAAGGLAEWCQAGQGWGGRRRPHSATTCATRWTRPPPACRRSGRWRSRAPRCRATRSPPAMPGRAGCWWCRSGSPTARASS